MIAARGNNDSSTRAATLFDYEEMFSVLMYYGHMSKDEIYHSSWRFLTAIYQKYINRAYENLGVSAKDSNDGKIELTDEDYPSEFKKYTKEEQEEEIAKSGISDEEFLKGFKEYNQH